MALWTPADIATALWLDASDSSTLITASGAVVQWKDKSGNIRSANQATAAKRPTVQANVKNALSVIRFDGSDDYLSVGSQLAKPPNHTIFLVGVMTNALSNSQAMCGSIDSAGGNSNSFGTILNRGTRQGRLEWSYGKGDVDTYGATTSQVIVKDVWSLYCCARVDGVLGDSIYVNGISMPSELFSSGAMSCNGGEPWEFSLGRFGGYNGFYLGGDIAEVVIATTILVESTRQKIEGYLAHKWGMASLLASDHPYKTYPPGSSFLPGTKFTLEGVARLNGSPVAADVSVYESVTGALRTKVKSSAVNGYYKIEDASSAIMLSGEKYFLLCNYGDGVRPLAHGPLTPAMENIATDPYWSNVVLMMNMEGSNNSTSFINLKNEAVLTALGDARISTTQKKFGLSSACFDGTGDALRIPYGVAFDPETQDFCFEVFVWLTSLKTGVIHLFGTYTYGVVDGGTLNSGWQLGIKADGKVSFGFGINSTFTTVISSTGAVATGVFTHIAVERSNGIVTVYLNGVASGSAASTHNIVMARSFFYVGGYNRGDSLAFHNDVSLTGYIDELRLTKGAARYKGNFTPPTEPFPQIQG